MVARGCGRVGGRAMVRQGGGGRGVVVGIVGVGCRLAHTGVGGVVGSPHVGRRELGCRGSRGGGPAVLVCLWSVADGGCVGGGGGVAAARRRGE